MFKLKDVDQFEGKDEIDYFIYKTNLGNTEKIEYLPTLKLLLMAGGSFLPIYKK